MAEEAKKTQTQVSESAPREGGGQKETGQHYSKGKLAGQRVVGHNVSSTERETEGPVPGGGNSWGPEVNVRVNEGCPWVENRLFGVELRKVPEAGKKSSNTKSSHGLWPDVK